MGNILKAIYRILREVRNILVNVIEYCGESETFSATRENKSAIRQHSLSRGRILQAACNILVNVVEYCG